MTTIAQQLNKEIADVLESVRRGLVQITSGGRGGGAGTIWHSDGLILTNAHVVQRDPIEVTLQDGSKHKARVLAHDSKADIAAIKIDASNLPTVPLGDSRELVPGQLVFALGHPLGMSGARLVTTALYQLQRTGGRYALCTMCIGVGQGIALVIENVV